MVILEFLTKTLKMFEVKVKVHNCKEQWKYSRVLVVWLYCLILRFPGMSKCAALLTITHLLREDGTKIFDGKDNK